MHSLQYIENDPMLLIMFATSCPKTVVFLINLCICSCMKSTI